MGVESQCPTSLRRRPPRHRQKDAALLVSSGRQFATVCNALSNEDGAMGTQNWKLFGIILEGTDNMALRFTE